MTSAREIPIRDEMVRLGQLLKLADMVDAGSDVKEVLASGTVVVNGAPATRRGRQLHRGDVIGIGETQLTIV